MTYSPRLLSSHASKDTLSKKPFSFFKPDPEILKVENKGLSTPYFNSRGHKVEGRGSRAQSESFLNRAHESHMEFAARKQDLIKSWRR